MILSVNAHLNDTEHAVLAPHGNTRRVVVLRRQVGEADDGAAERCGTVDVVPMQDRAEARRHLDNVDVPVKGNAYNVRAGEGCTCEIVLTFLRLFFQVPFVFSRYVGVYFS